MQRLVALVPPPGCMDCLTERPPFAGGGSWPGLPVHGCTRRLLPAPVVDQMTDPSVHRRLEPTHCCLSRPREGCQQWQRKRPVTCGQVRIGAPRRLFSCARLQSLQRRLGRRRPPRSVEPAMSQALKFLSVAFVSNPVMARPPAESVGEKIGRSPESGWNQISPTISPTQSVRFAEMVCYLMRPISIVNQRLIGWSWGGMTPPETSLDVLHLNVEFHAKCLSHMKVVFQPARTPHNLPHRLRVLRRAEACLEVVRAACEL